MATHVLRSTMSIAVAVATPLLLSASIHADLIINSDTDEILDVEYTVGDGPNTSYLVVDFGATGGDAYGFAYQWSFEATGLDMLEALDAGGGLDVDIQGSDFGSFVANFNYQQDAGEPNNFWAYHTAEPKDIDPGVDWTFSELGMADRMLQDGSLDGWYNGFDGIEPAVPTVVIPAPPAFGLLGVMFITRRRRRRG